MARIFIRGNSVQCTSRPPEERRERERENIVALAVTLIQQYQSELIAREKRGGVGNFAVLFRRFPCPAGGRGHTYAHENNIDQICSFLCESYIFATLIILALEIYFYSL